MSTNVRTQTRQTTAPGENPPDNEWRIISDTGALGGGGTPIQAVIAITSPQGSIKPGDTVTLDGSGSTGQGTLTYTWTQPHGTTVKLSPSNNASTVTFTANDNVSRGQSVAHTLGFQLSIRDTRGFTSVATQSVTVNPQTTTGSTPTPTPTPSPTTTTTTPLKFTADVTNHSSKLTSDQLQTLCAAVKKQLDNEGAKYWGYTAAFEFDSTKFDSSHAKLGVFDNADQPGDLGWHDDESNQVTIEVFYVGTLSDVGVTISHEMLETIGDYNANTTVPGIDPSGKPCTFFTENCLTGDTKIPLLEGKEYELKDLVNRDYFWVYSLDSERNIVAGKGHSARITRHNAKLIEVGLDNGQFIKCTLDHRFMTRDGSFKPAKDLRHGDSLMPLYKRMQPLEYSGNGLIRSKKYDYEQVLVPRTNSWEFTHKIILSDWEKGMVINPDCSLCQKVAPVTNHKVTSVRQTASADVYDITVDKYHNFALSAGVFVHNCDPVESDTYKIDGVDVSNFVTPAWFKLPSVSGTPDGRFDYLKNTSKQFEIDSGGYMEISYDGGNTWTQVQERTSGFDKFSGSRKRLRDKRKREGVFRNRFG